MKFYVVNEHKCEVCGREYKREQDLNTHETKKKNHPEQFRKVTGAAKKAEVKVKNEATQDLLPKEKWVDVSTEN